MRVEFDPVKDRINRRKHGISLARAENFDFAGAEFTLDNRRDYGEQRWKAIGFLDAHPYALVLTFINDETVRAISLRKANKEEQEFLANPSAG